MATRNPRKLAELIMAWSDAEVDPVTIAMRLTDVDRSVIRKAMKIVREVLMPAKVEREVDEDFARRGRYSTPEELRASAAASESQQHLTEADFERLKDAALETLTAVVADHADAGGVEIVRAFRKRLARRAAGQ